MFFEMYFKIKPEVFKKGRKKEVYEPPEFKNMWYSAFILLVVGDEAVRLITTRFPAILREYTHIICIVADDNEASAIFNSIKHCFRSCAVIGLGVDGCGKNAMVGCEVLHPIALKIAFKINKYLNTLKSKYGVLPSTFVQLIFSGGTSSGYALKVSPKVKKIVRSLDNKSQIIDFISVSRGDYPPQIANSVLVSIKLLKDVGERNSVILSYFDREPTLRDLSDLNILCTIMSLLLSKYRAGMNRIDISDLIGRGGVFTTNTEYRSTANLNLNSVNGEAIFNLAKRAIDFDLNSLHARAAFHGRDSELIRVSVISPIPISDLEMFGRKFEFTENLMADGYYLPIKYLPVSVTAFLKGDRIAAQQFFTNYRRVVDDAIPELENYMGIDVVDEEDLQSFIEGGELDV